MTATRTVDPVELAMLRRSLPSPAMRRAIREQAGLSIAEVAAAVGATRQCVSMWELANRTPRQPFLSKYIDLLRRLQEALQ